SGPMVREAYRTGTGRLAPSERSSLAVAHGEGAQAQRVELDEAGGVLLVVGAFVVLEGDKRRRIERLSALAPDDRDIALVELQPHLALDVLLALVDRRLQHLALGRKPEPVGDDTRIARHPIVS